MKEKSRGMVSPLFCMEDWLQGLAGFRRTSRCIFELVFNNERDVLNIYNFGLVKVNGN